MGNSSPEEPTTPEEEAEAEEPSSLPTTVNEDESEAGESPQELEELPQAIQQARMASASFTGPLPPPGMLRAYDDVVPGLAKRIASTREREQEHRFQ